MGSLDVMRSKGQMQIQQMAFVLVATVVFFVIVGIFYISFRFSSINQNVGDLKKQGVIETVRGISGSPEFSWNSFEDCPGCIDLDKVFVLKNRPTYKNFWGDIPLMKVERVYPLYNSTECNEQSYPRCNEITFVDNGNYEAYEAFVSLCRYEGESEQVRCDLGKVIMGFENGA